MYSEDKLKSAFDQARLNIIKESTTDVEVFNRPFEIDYLKNKADVETLRNSIVNRIIEAANDIKNKIDHLYVHKIGHVLVPKKSLGDFRRCALIDVYDELLYLTLTVSLAHDLEKYRIKKSKNIVFSYRFMRKPDGAIFDPDVNYARFRKEMQRKKHMKKNKVMVTCDISNFYDRLNLHRLNSALLAMKDIDNDIVAILDDLLLYWSNRDSYGIPVGSNGSRILAEAALIDIDQTLINNGVDFIRFVDDYRIFAKDAGTAQKHLAILNNRLSQDGLYLNASKTQIEDISMFISTKKNEQDLQKENFVTDFEKLKLIRGYTGIIPTKFRELSKSQMEKYKQFNVEVRLLQAYVFQDHRSPHPGYCSGQRRNVC